MRLRLYPKQVQRYRVCAWVSLYLGVERATWTRIVESGLVTIEAELRAECLERGLDWDELAELALNHRTMSENAVRDARERGGQVREKQRGMPLIGACGAVDL